MNTLFNLVVVVQVLSALIIIGLVLLQHGKGADMGAAFGSGASGSLFGATGSSNFMSKSTGVAAAIFFASTLALAYFGTAHNTTVGGGGLMERAPAVPVSATGGAVVPSTLPATAPAAAPVVAPNGVPATAAPAAAAPAPAAAAPAASAPAAPASK